VELLVLLRLEEPEHFRLVALLLEQIRLERLRHNQLGRSQC
jgi:hypothetical protein